jgi:hypothetical protein
MTAAKVTFAVEENRRAWFDETVAAKGWFDPEIGHR